MTTIKNFSEGDKVRFVIEGAVKEIGTVTQVAKNRKYVWVTLPSSDGSFAYTVKVFPATIEIVEA